MMGVQSGVRELGWAPLSAHLRRSPISLNVALLLVGLSALYIPTFWRLSQSVWAQEEQGHGPVILAVSVWLAVSKLRGLTVCSKSEPDASTGWFALAIGLFAYVIGRSQSIWMLEVGSLIPILAAVILFTGGRLVLRALWFPLAFLFFMVPLPEALVATATAPLKQAVAVSASTILNAFGYPVGRSGVILTIAQYQLFVADACAGLNSIFTLEALGLLYMQITGHRSIIRNGVFAALLVPISFCSNVIRVIALVLVTYYFGDAAAQGFIHDFAGVLLFGVALCLMFAADSGLMRLSSMSSLKR